MNYSTAIFLINSRARAIMCTYEVHDGASPYMLKTLDPSIKVDDYVIVPTDSRHKMTVVKVVEVDVDVDFDKAYDVKWILGVVDTEANKELIGQEQAAIKAIQSAELTKKRKELRDAMLADHVEEIKALPISDMNGDEAAKPESD